VALSLLDMFAKIQKATASSVMSVGWSVCLEQLSPTEWIVMEFYIWVLSVKKIQVSLKYDNNEYFT
jgi:hypothetical protein